MDYSEKEKDEISQNLFIQLQETKPIIFQENLQILDSSDRTCNSSFKDYTTSSGYGGRRNGSRERELLFEKIVTPSNVGKLNRLVIPKQFAERYLDSSDRTCNSSFKDHTTSSGYGGRRNGSRERELLFEKIVTPSNVGKLNRLVIPNQFAEKHLGSSDRTCNSSFKDHTTSSGYGGRRNGSRERELLFEKIVTPSDVGKLNRLVIPKQFAEKHFPLHSSTNEKGLFLTFEDRNGEQWRFRYSYWKSSQSFVITKGWSRFVKDKQLHAGDVVSFERYVPETGKNDRHFWIDWKHRPNIVLPQGDLYFDRKLHDFKQTNFGFDSFCNVDRLSTSSQSSRAKAVMESVPLIRHCRSSEANPKRLRLFGVNLECPEEPKLRHFGPLDSSSVSHNQANLPKETPLLEISAQFSSTGKDAAFFPFHWDP